jgi:hypothetical protein
MLNPAAKAALRPPEDHNDATAVGQPGASALPSLKNQQVLPRLAYSPAEAAAVLGVSRDYFDEHIGPELRWVRRGRRKLVSVRELEKWLDMSAAMTLGGYR